MLDHSSFDRGEDAFPEAIRQQSWCGMSYTSQPTPHERRCENVRGGVDQATFARDASSGQWIVARDHPARKVGGAERLNGWRGPRLELVFEDDQTKELQVRLRLFAADGSSAKFTPLNSGVVEVPLELLGLQP